MVFSNYSYYNNNHLFAHIYMVSSIHNLIVEIMNLFVTKSISALTSEFL